MPKTAPTAAHRPPHQVEGRGFTLVELLTVIAIIAVLLAILLPTLGAVRTAARKASTQSLMREVRTAIDVFQTDHQRLPGRFSAQEMGATPNLAQSDGGSNHGFTAMENALLELSVGELRDTNDDPEPSEDNNIIDVGPVVQNDKVRLDMLSVGAGDGPGYLSLSQEHLRPIRGQATNDDRVVGGDQRIIGMPDVIDYFGQPVMLWSRNQTASLPPDAIVPQDEDVGFAALSTDDGAASFYWSSNAGYLSAGDPEAVSGENRQIGLGRERINQFEESVLGADNDEASDQATGEQRVFSLMGVLGSPAFSTQPDMGNPQGVLPAAARGDAVILSAGADQIYFKKRGEGSGAAVGYKPRLESGDAAMNFPAVDDFDDLLDATGG